MICSRLLSLAENYPNLARMLFTALVSWVGVSGWGWWQSASEAETYKSTTEIYANVAGQQHKTITEKVVVVKPVAVPDSDTRRRVEILESFHGIR